MDVIDKIVAQAKEQCTDPSEGKKLAQSIEEQIRSVSAYSALDQLKCILNVIDNVLSTAEADVANLWQKTRRQLENVVQNLKQCKELPVDEVNKYVNTFEVFIYSIKITNFYLQMCAYSS